MEELASIRQLREQYCRFVDAKDWDELEAILTVDYLHYSATAAGVAPVLVAESAKAFRDRLQGLTSGATTVHACFMPRLTIIDAQTARGIWSMTDLVTHLSNASMQFSGRGYYDDDYRRGSDGLWRIAITRLSRQRLDPLSSLLATDRDLADRGHST